MLLVQFSFYIFNFMISFFIYIFEGFFPYPFLVHLEWRAQSMKLKSSFVCFSMNQILSKISSITENFIHRNLGIHSKVIVSKSWKRDWTSQNIVKINFILINYKKSKLIKQQINRNFTYSTVNAPKNCFVNRWADFRQFHEFI